MRISSDCIDDKVIKPSVVEEDSCLSGSQWGVSSTEEFLEEGVVYKDSDNNRISNPKPIQVGEEVFDKSKSVLDELVEYQKAKYAKFK